MKIIEQIAIELMINVIADGGTPMRHEKDYSIIYSEQDKIDLVNALNDLNTTLSLFDYISNKFPHFEGIRQFDKLIDWIVSPEENNWNEFILIYPEYKEINKILSRPF